MSVAGDYGQALAFLTVWAAKATVLLGVAAAANLFLRRQSAALRHQVWAIAIIGALALPLASLALPAWHVISAPATVAVSAPAKVSISVSGADISTVPVRRHWDWGAAIPTVLVLWLVGCAIFLLRLMAGFARLGRTAAYSRVATANCLTAIAAELRDRFGIRRMIRVLESASATTMPMTWGILRPRIVLPRGVAEWDPQRQRMVLSHELAHVSRCDWAFQISAELLRACFWFHPFAWIAGNRLREESERACDDAVLNSGLATEKYASELLALTGALKTDGRDFSLALAIARPSNLERRFAAMLDPSICRNGISRKRSLLGMGLGACLLLPLAALALSAEPPKQLPGNAAMPAAAAVTTEQPESALAGGRNGIMAGPHLVHAAGAAADVAPAWPAGRGRDAFLKDCSGCHAAEDVIGQNLDTDGWTNVLNQMTQFGATIPKADFSDVVDYLATNFGAKSPRAASSEAAAETSAGSQASPVSSSSAQTAASASVSGVLEDPSGAVIPGVDVRLSQSNAATLEMYVVVRAGSNGEFTFPAVVPATYELTVDAAGFRRYSQKDIQLQPGEHLNLHALDLQVGAITQEVTVTARQGPSVRGSSAPPESENPCVAPPVQTSPPPGELPPGRVRVGGVVEAASIVCQSVPIYPDVARLAGIGGTVVMNAVIGKDGTILSLQVVNPGQVDGALATAAQDGVKTWRYRPTILDGQPIEVSTEINVVFVIAK